MLEPTIKLIATDFVSISDTRGERVRLGVDSVGAIKHLLTLRYAEDPRAKTFTQNAKLENATPSSVATLPNVTASINITLRGSQAANATDLVQQQAMFETGLKRLIAFYAGLHNSGGSQAAAWPDATLLAAVLRGQQ